MWLCACGKIIFMGWNGVKFLVLPINLLGYIFKNSKDGLGGLERSRGYLHVYFLVY